MLAVLVTGFFVFDLLETSRETTGDKPEEAALYVGPELKTSTEKLSIPIEEVRITSNASGADIGFARRGVSSDTFTHAAVITLPEIYQAEFFYEGWLVQPGTLEFFSTGEMIRRADGAFSLVYEESVFEVNPDVYEFSNIVITLEPRDGNPDPAPAHVARGAFVQKQVNLIQ